jgi:hypothetical protein
MEYNIIQQNRTEQNRTIMERGGERGGERRGEEKGERRYQERGGLSVG